MKNVYALVLLALVAVLGSGCASRPSSIGTTYVNPMMYQNYDCEQITLQMHFVNGRVMELYNQLENSSNKDALVGTASFLFFWPAAILMEGDGAEAAEYSRLKGEYEALRQMAIIKKCNMGIMPLSPDQVLDGFKEGAGG